MSAENQVVDQAGKVREGEALDANAIDGFFKSVLPELVGEPEITQFPGGASNLTYQISYGDQAFILRPSTVWQNRKKCS